MRSIIFTLMFIAFAFSASATIIVFDGYVTDGSTGLGINNANVSVSNSTVFLNSTLTSATGYYNMTAEDGTGQVYTLTANATGFNVNTVNPVVAPAVTYVSRNFSLGPQAVVTLSGNVNKSAAPAQPLSGVNVMVKIGSSTIATNTTDSSGHYEFTELLNATTYTINFVKSAYYENNTNITTSGNTTLNLLMDLEPTTGTLNGTIKDQFGTPVQGATIYFKSFFTNSSLNDTTTDANGVYTINLPQNTFNIVAEETGYIGNRTDGVVLVNGQTVTKNMGITKTSTVSGTTTPAGVNVTFRKNGADAYSLISNSATGAFTQTVEVGFYNITSTKSGYYDSSITGANFTADASEYSITLSAIPPQSSGGSSSTPSTGSGSSDYAPETTALSYSYSFASVPANRATGMVFKNVGVNQITFETMQELKNADFKLEKYDEKPAGLPDAPGAAYKFIKIDTKNVPGEAIKYVRFNFEASNSWINEKGINLESVKLYRLVGGKWTELSTKKTGQTSEATYYEANSPGFSFFAIAAGTASAPEGQQPQQPQQPVSGTGGDIIITPDGQTGAETTNGTVPPITGGAVGAAFKGKPMFTYSIIGLLIVAAIFLAVYYSRQSNKGLKRSKKGSRK